MERPQKDLRRGDETPAADIFCLQEVFAPQNEDIRKAFPGYIALGYDGPEMDAATGTAYFGIAKNMVLFSKKRYELLAAGTYWLSGNAPDRGFDVMGNGPRPPFQLGATPGPPHGQGVPRGVDPPRPHLAAGPHGANRSLYRRGRAIPCRIPADTRRRLQFEARKSGHGGAGKAGWHDAWPEANGADAVREPSFHGFKGEMYKAKGKPGPIDFIFLKGAGIKAVESHLVKDSVKGILPSDHYFLSADIVIE